MSNYSRKLQKAIKGLAKGALENLQKKTCCFKVILLLPLSKCQTIKIEHQRATEGNEKDARKRPNSVRMLFPCL